MQTVEFGQKYENRIVVCLGFFDCMHTGHVALLNKAKQLAIETNSQVALFTFSNNHFQALGKPTKLLYSFEERLIIYKNLGIDVVLSAHFDKTFMAIKGRDFLQTLATYNLQGVVCGFDYSCGSDRLTSNDVKTHLCSVCPVEVVEQISLDGVKVSSTLVRQLIGENNVEKANSLLSQDFFVVGKVVHGRGVGKNNGFPTANVLYSNDKLLPSGVFGACVVIDGKPRKAIVNVGSCPTYGVEQKSLEAHVVGFDGDLYGKTIEIRFKKFLRPTQKFQSQQSLAEQLKKDLESVAND